MRLPRKAELWVIFYSISLYFLTLSRNYFYDQKKIEYKVKKLLLQQNIFQTNFGRYCCEALQVFSTCQRVERCHQVRGQRREPKLGDRFQDCGPALCPGASTRASVHIAQWLCRAHVIFWQQGQPKLNQLIIPISLL